MNTNYEEYLPYLFFRTDLHIYIFCMEISLPDMV